MNDDIKYIREKVDGIDRKVAGFEPYKDMCIEDRKNLFAKTNLLRNDVTKLQTSVKYTDKSRNSYFDNTIKILMLICSASIVVFWLLKTLKLKG